MAVNVDIFNPQISKIAYGLEGKVILLYGGNNLGKTHQSCRMNKPFVMACESGLNAQSGVAYNKINNWADFKKIVKQFTSKATVDKAKELYSTIIIDEVYASSIMCQDYVIATYGNGALTLGDSEGKINLYQMYEKEYFRQINLLVGAGYTVVFIAHAQEKNDYISPKGDKRAINPIVDNSDFVVYLQSNGVDEDGKVIKSSAYLAETDSFFARSRFEHTPTYIEEFTAENLEAAIIEGIKKEEEISGVKTVSYEEQKEQNTTVKMTFDEVQEALQVVGERFYEADKMDILTEIVEDNLGVGGKVSSCTKKQLEVLLVIYDELTDKAEELGI